MRRSPPVLRATRAIAQSAQPTKALADLIGISQGAINRYERDMDEPLQKRIEAMSRHLGVPESFFCPPD